MITERTVVQNLLENCQAGQIEKFTVDEVRNFKNMLITLKIYTERFIDYRKSVLH